MLDNLEKGLELKIVDNADMVQLRGQQRIMTYCSVKNGVVDGFAKIHLTGMSARAYVNSQSWGFCSTNLLDSDSINQTLTHAIKLGQAASTFKHKKLKLKSTPLIETVTTLPLKKPPSNLSTQETVEIPMDAYQGAMQAGSQVTDVETTYISIEDDKYFVSSDGSKLQQETTKVLLFVNVIAKQGASICPASENLAHAGGIELFDEQSPFSMGKTVAETAVRLLDAPAPPSGKWQVIIHPTLCATLLHEAIGHPLEADLALSGGGFGSQLNQKVSSDLVTIYDDGRVPHGLGYFVYDDEGVECRRTDLIKNGVLKSFMHDRMSAAVTRAPLTGNSHAWDYSVEPLIRQTNIGLEPGTWSIEEMIEDVKEGLLLEGTFGGQADVNADFTFGFQNAKQIRKGRVQEEMRGANVAGNAIEVFNSIDAISREDVLRPGSCGKSQFAIQGRIAPAIRCEILVGGSGGQ